MSLRFTQRRQRWALLGDALLVTLLTLCAWGGWVAAQPDLGIFLLPGARDIRYAPVGPGMQSVLFTYDGEVVPQTDRLYSTLERHGWQVGQSPRREDCSDLCILGQFTLVFTRRSLFDLVSEVATVEQSCAGPYTSALWCGAAFGCQGRVAGRWVSTVSGLLSTDFGN